MSPGAPTLAALDVGGPAEPWERVGFAIESGRTGAGEVELRFDPATPPGLRALALHGVAPGATIDGIPCTAPSESASAPAHPNRVARVDHVVVTTPRLDRTLAALAAVGLEVRRTRGAGDGMRQAFLVAGPAVLEVVGDTAGTEAPRLWGITFVVPDVDALAADFRDAVGTPRDAVQPGRRIVTVRQAAGLGVPVAFMTPR
jgi:hypothetical protein